MAIGLLFIMLAVFVTDFVVEVLYGVFSKQLEQHMVKGLAAKYVLLLIGFGAIALISWAAQYWFDGAKYLSGILLEPIARYFIALMDKLRMIMTKEQVIGAQVIAKEPVAVHKNKKESEAVAGEAAKPSVISEMPAADKPTRSRRKTTKA